MNETRKPTAAEARVLKLLKEGGRMYWPTHYWQSLFSITGPGPGGRRIVAQARKSTIEGMIKAGLLDRDLRPVQPGTHQSGENARHEQPEEPETAPFIGSGR